MYTLDEKVRYLIYKMLFIFDIFTSRYKIMDSGGFDSKAVVSFGLFISFFFFSQKKMINYTISS